MKKYVKSNIAYLIETNISLAEINLSCHRDTMYLHINPSPSIINN